MPSFHVFAAAAIAAAVMAAPQSTYAQQTQLKPVYRPTPLPRPVTPPTPRPQAEIVLRNLPDDMLTIMQDADWPNPQRNPGILGVTRRSPPRHMCRQLSDSIDLRRIRANGFRVVSYTLNDGLGPNGYKVAGHSNIRPFKYASPNSDRLLNANTPAEIDRISVTPKVWVLDIWVGSNRQRMGCAATWGLEIRVVGPKGINPYTGRPQ